MRPFANLLISILLNYGSNLAPYYVKIFAGDRMSVIGSLASYSENCENGPTPEAYCAIKYVVPLSGISAPHDAIGVGIFLWDLKAYCVKNSITSELNDMSSGETALLNHYRVLNLQGKSCDSVILKNFVPLSQTRFGQSSGAAVVGSLDWVMRAKSLAEVFRKQIFLCQAALLLALYFAVRKLRDLTGSTVNDSPFAAVFSIWIAMTALNAGLFDLLAPPIGRLSQLRNVTLFCGGLLVCCTTFEILGKPIRQRYLVNKKILRYIFAIFLCGTLSYLGSRAYAAYLAVFGLMLMIRDHRTSSVLFGLTLISDAAKVVNVRFLPESRVSITLMGFYIFESFLREVEALAFKIRDEGGYDLAERLAHDMRSPIGALKIALRMPESEKNIKDELSN